MINTDCNNLDNTCTRIVLFEKHDQYLGSVILTNFKNFGHYNVGHYNVDINSAKYAIEILNESIKDKTLFGEMRLTEDDECFQGIIDLRNVSHTIKNIFLKGNKIYGEINFVDTPSGRIAKDFIKGGFKFKIKIRAIGNINNGITEIAEIITWDVVPSENRELDKEHLGWNVIM